MKGTARCLIAVLLIAGSATVQGQEPRAAQPAVDAEDHWIVFELGAAGDWARGDAIHNGGTFAVELTPIEHWLEVEIGATALATDPGVEMPFDVLFKKPWQPSPKFELMIGAGPELVHASGPKSGTFWGVEGVLDFMFWPKKNVGWYIEPGYEIIWRNGVQHRGVGFAIGVLFGR